MRGLRVMGGLAVLCLGWTDAVAADAVELTDENRATGDLAADGQPTGEQETARPLTEEEQIAARMAAFEASLGWQQGDVPLGNGLATLSLGNDLRFLGSEDAGRVLEAWGNPPGAQPLGMVFPAGMGALDDDSWGVVVTYEEEGHVEDDDAADIDYAELLEEMQEGAEASNEARVEAGFSPVRLIGWAEPPHYDAQSKKLYWAKELDFGDEPHGLNYAVRVLGRKGVLQLNAVASIPQLPMIRGEMTKVMGRVNFDDGNRYADFDPELDEVAAYGIGALIAGKAAAKVGLFKGLVALLLASKKLLIAGAVAVAAALRKLFGGRGAGTDSESDAT